MTCGKAESNDSAAVNIVPFLLIVAEFELAM